MEQYVKGFQRFHAGEDVRPITYLLQVFTYSNITSPERQTVV